MILSKEVEIVLNGANLKHYENLGYKIPRHKNASNGKMQFENGTKIIVKVKDLTKGNKVRIQCKCEKCGKERSLEYYQYRDICAECLKKGYSGQNNPNFDNHKLSGKNNPMFGKKHTDEVRKRISILNIGKRIGEDHPRWNPNKSEFHKYWLEVTRETNKSRKKLFEEWNGLDYYTNEDISNLKPFNITVDHKISVKYGFENQINPKIIGEFTNLCICSRSVNASKNFKNDKDFY